MSLKNMSFGKLLGLFAGGFVVFLVAIMVIASLATSKKKEEITVQVNEPQQQQQQQSQNLPQQPPQQNATGDIDSYIAGQDNMRDSASIQTELKNISRQMVELQTAVNQTNENIMGNMKKMEADLILLDQRITNLEQNKATQQKTQQNSSIQNMSRKGKGSPLKSNNIQATVGNKVWVNETNQSRTIATGDFINRKKITYVDDIKNVVYVK